MADFTIVDRRESPGGKNLGNRQRFIKKAKEHLKKSVQDGLAKRSITSSDDQEVTISHDGVHEPAFHNDRKTGKKEFVLPGNKDFVPGDIIEKPKGGKGSGASDSGEGEDEFQFQISRDEFNEILFDGLELPDLIKKSDKRSVSFVRTRTGFTSQGNPCSLDLENSMIRSLGRRIALKNPKLKKIKILEEELALCIDEERKLEIEEEIKALRKKVEAITYLDPIDLRYRNFENKPVPKHQAVMFCIMDVSGSMGKHEKDLAKRFYLLLYLFLSYKYQHVDVVYIRHHSIASECTEEEFFYSKETGGTIVSQGFVKMAEIVKERYPLNEWNLYTSYTSDGDNFAHDNPVLVDVLTNQILPMTQFFTYLEVAEDNSPAAEIYRATNGLWPHYEKLSAENDHMKLKKATKVEDVYSVFRELFEQE